MLAKECQIRKYFVIYKCIAWNKSISDNSGSIGAWDPTVLELSHVILQLWDEIWGSNWSVISGIRVRLDGSAINPVENLGEENNLDNFLEESPAEEDGTTKVVVESWIVLTDVDPVAEGVPVIEERSHGGESDHIFEDDSHEWRVEKGDHQPGHGGGDIRHPSWFPSCLVLHNPGGSVKDLVDKHSSEAHDKGVDTIPENGLSIISLTDKVVGEVSGVWASLLIVVGHSCSNFF